MAAFEREAVAKLEHAALQVDSGIWFYDDFVAEGSHRSSAVATSCHHPSNRPAALPVAVVPGTVPLPTFRLR